MKRPSWTTKNIEIPDGGTAKVCRSCGRPGVCHPDRNLSDFYLARDPRRKNPYYRHMCKRCDVIQAEIYRSDHPEKAAAWGRRYRATESGRAAVARGRRDAASNPAKIRRRKEYRGDVLYRLKQALYRARRRHAANGNPRSAATIVALEAEIARVAKSRLGPGAVESVNSPEYRKFAAIMRSLNREDEGCPESARPGRLPA